MSTDAARKFLAEIEEALEPATAYRDPSPVPAIGPTPPVTQPGRPPMSQRATDASALMLAAGAASLPIGGATSLVLYTLGHVDPIALAIGAAGPVALVLAVGSLVRAASRGLQGIKVEHNHYSGTVVHKTRVLETQNRGLFAKTINKH